MPFVTLGPVALGNVARALLTGSVTGLRTHLGFEAGRRPFDSRAWWGEPVTAPAKLALIGVVLTPLTLLCDYRLGLGLVSDSVVYTPYAENGGLPVSYQQLFGITQALWLLLGLYAVSRRDLRSGFASLTCLCLAGLLVLVAVITEVLEGIDGYAVLALSSTLVPLTAMAGVLLHPEIRAAELRRLVLVFALAAAVVTAGTLAADVVRGSVGERFDLFLFGPPTDTGLVLAMTLVLLAAASGPRLLVGAIGLVLLAGLVATQTRGALVMLLAAAFVVVLLLPHKRRALIAFVAAGLAVTVLAFLLLSKRSLLPTDESNDLRRAELDRHWQLFLSRPTFGYGLAEQSAPFSIAAHNAVLGIANAAGVGGALLWLVAWIGPPVRALRRHLSLLSVVSAAVVVGAFVGWFTTGTEILIYTPPTNLLPLLLAVALIGSSPPVTTAATPRDGRRGSISEANAGAPTRRSNPSSMSVLLTVERYPPAIGGAERVAQRVAEGLAERGHSVTVMTSGPRQSEVRSGVSVERFPIRGNRNVGFQGDIGAPLDLVARLDPDVVFSYAAQTWPTDVCSDLLDRPERPAMVLGPCGFSALHEDRWRGYFEDLEQRLPLYDALIFHSAKYQDWDFAVSAGAERLHVIPNGADPAPDGGRRKTDRDRPLLLTVGSHVHSKGHGDFARVLRSVRRTRPARGLIVAPPRRGRDIVRGCQPRCHARNVLPGNGLKMMDGRARANVDAAFASADVFLLPSKVECSPLVIIEAMAAGVPWISYDVGNVHELAGGIVVDDRAEMADRVPEVLDGEHPRLGAEGRRAWEQHHRWGSLLSRYERVLELARDRNQLAISRNQSLATRTE